MPAAPSSLWVPAACARLRGAMKRPDRTRCRKCGARIVFARREDDGEWQSFDEDPLENGRWYLYRPRGNLDAPLRCRFMRKGADWPPGSLCRRPHWMTCPDPDAKHLRRTPAQGGRSPKTSPEDLRRIEDFLQQKRG